MTSFQITIEPHQRAAGRFIGSVRRGLQKAYAEAKKNNGLKQSDIARTIGVHRSVINRELTGLKDMTLGRVAELAHILGRKAVISFPEILSQPGQNIEANQQPLEMKTDYYFLSEQNEDSNNSDFRFEVAAQ
ncbi:helix-turn-helix transcriptional regulator [Bradyrhizobium sp. AUGA SZCCT0431]|uniref:helix-turn-helix domain-containing protein n=1 Tax=Bradyrhizobium sp. AUGA SZCCT0431 TaxID=2807674 RepID=UPI001BA97304|nr:helix-turn-helix transcriptional regulator [Bradyrhizobium sp. AUGA SZCCT0431]MBR1148369.1 helix-turn-helix transcriptional regulator [Bradyrhizobium sp. AUGA SZCCT0431]